MATSNTERMVFAEIQKKLFYMIPEKWDAIYLYASIIEEPFKKPVGEMYFYYIPKGILRRKPVNVYQIPSMFNIDEESYNDLIQKLYIDIKELRKIHRETKPELWSNLTLTIENTQFKIEYGYEDLGENSEFSPYERHIIWRYKNLKSDVMIQSKEEKDIINRYLNSNLPEFEKQNKDVYIEGIYKQQAHNIIDYEKTMTIEAAIATQGDEAKENRKIKKEKKKNKVISKGEVERELNDSGNQILFSRVETMRKKVIGNDKNDKIEKSTNQDDDIILNSEFMRGKK